MTYQELSAKNGAVGVQIKVYESPELWLTGGPTETPRWASCWHRQRCRACGAVSGLHVPLGRGSLTGLRNPPLQQQSGPSEPERRTTALGTGGALPYSELLPRTKTTNPTQTKSFGNENKEARTKGMIFQSFVGSTRDKVWGKGSAQRLRWVGP